MQRTNLPSRAKDITGKRFGRLIALFPMDDGVVRKGNPTKWLMQCDCGKKHLAGAASLSIGQTVSCGCLKKERMIALGKNSATHGMGQSPEYKSWCKMKERCYAKNHRQYHDWGGRVIIV